MRKLVLILLCCSAASGAILLNSFNSGKLSKDLKYRTDLEQHAMASETLTNILVRPQGMAYKRPGTEYIDTKRTSIVTPATPGEYPTLRATTDQTDPGLSKTTAISSFADLQNISNDLTGNYYLTTDIDATGSAFTPLGNGLTTWFTGTFDGCGYTIDGLNIDSTGQYKALFGSIKDATVIANVTLTNVDILGRNRTAGLVGEATGTASGEPLIQNCHVSSGTIKVKPGGSAYQVGGLIGYAEGDENNDYYVYIYDCSTGCSVDENGALVTYNFGGFVGLAEYAYIKNCYATGNVIGGNDTATIGGFAGQITNATYVGYSYATGNVTGAERTGGGFVGGNANVPGAGLIEKCYATGDLTNTGGSLCGPFGGFVGENANGGDIQNCYAWGDVSSDQAGAEVGGFVGDDTTIIADDQQFKQCYAIGAVTGQSDPGGFSGKANAGMVSDCYWDTQTSGTETTGDGAEGQTTAWLKNKTNFPVAWDFDTIWYNPYAAGSTVDAGNAIRLIPFEYSTEDAYVMEFGHTYIGFFRTTQ